MGGSGGRKKGEMIQYYSFKKIKEIFLNVTQNDQQPGTPLHEPLPQRYCGILFFVLGGNKLESWRDSYMDRTEGLNR